MKRMEKRMEKEITNRVIKAFVVKVAIMLALLYVGVSSLNIIALAIVGFMVFLFCIECTDDNHDSKEEA